MKLYYHKTDGGAEYYCTKHIDGCDEGDMTSAIMRTDGDEIEVFERNIVLQGLSFAMPMCRIECNEEV